MFDHMFSHSNYTVFMMSMLIGKQRIPLWFRCFEGKSCPDAFKETLIKEGITYVSNLFTEDKVVYLDKKENHEIRKTLAELPRYKYRVMKYPNIKITEEEYETNIVISDYADTIEPWGLATNKNLN